MTLRTDRTGDDTEPPGLPAEITAADVLRLVMRDGDKRLRRFAVDIDSGRVSLHFEPAEEATEVERDDATGADLDPEAKVIRMLESLRPGEWMSGRAIAGELGLTYGGGRFKAVMKPLLATGGDVESHKVHGYRLRRRPN